MKIVNACASRSVHNEIQDIFDNMSEGIAVFDKDLRYVFANQITKKYSGMAVSKRIGKNIWEIYPELIHSNIYDAYYRVLKTKKYERIEIQGPKTKVWFEHTIYPYHDGALTVYRDVTERKNHELEELRQDRLKLINLMAAGISHEVRNPITTVKGFLQLFLSKHAYEDHKDQFELMISELERANSIITEFLSVAKGEIGERQNKNVNDIIKALEPLLVAQATIKNSEISFQLGNTPDIFVNEKEIRQLLLNIVNNGLEAMPTGGQMVITTYSDANAITLQITDEGTGISPDVLNRLGTPFLTTKETGTGLGVAICYGIAQRHNAKIHVDSNDHGTTFCVQFPVSVN